MTSVTFINFSESSSSTIVDFDFLNMHCLKLKGILEHVLFRMDAMFLLKQLIESRRRSIILAASTRYLICLC
ncbi:hypothetical protein H5410_056318 [Solanum commersonii]|uniref:Uncharacterized protein n=1 Tax=Solanum commersonii TaxID=4109 RepID=A0A9J5WMD3_SOLCO|nr:hypothetical protein H5410_056318 [Solanum commersonii]